MKTLTLAAALVAAAMLIVTPVFAQGTKPNCQPSASAGTSSAGGAKAKAPEKIERWKGNRDKDGKMKTEAFTGNAGDSSKYSTSLTDLLDKDGKLDSTKGPKAFGTGRSTAAENQDGIPALSKKVDELAFEDKGYTATNFGGEKASSAPPPVLTEAQKATLKALGAYEA